MWNILQKAKKKRDKALHSMQKRKLEMETMKTHKDVELLKKITDELEFDRSIAIFVRDGELLYTTYGKTKELCDVSALDGQKLAAVIEGSPTSYEQAIGMANAVMERLNKTKIKPWEQFVKEQLGEFEIQKGSQFEARLLLAYEEMCQIFKTAEHQYNYRIQQLESELESRKGK